MSGAGTGALKPALQTGMTTMRSHATSKETEAFHAFYLKSVRPLAAFFRQRGIRDTQRLEDLIQDTYLEAFKSFGQVRDQNAATAWLLTIGSRQLARTIARSAAAGRTVSLEPENGNEEIQTLSDEPSPEEHLRHNSLLSGALGILAGIADPVRRRAVEMFIFEDHSLKEIAAETGAGTSTVTTWISRFRQDAQQLLRGPRHPAANPSTQGIKSGNSGRTGP